MPQEEYLAIGYIFKTKGLKGEVKVKPLGRAEHLKPGKTLRINPPLETTSIVKVEKASLYKDSYSVKFEGIESVSEAEELKKHYLEIKKADLPEDIYYSHELIGMKISSAGEIIGEVEDVLESKAHDILVVKGCHSVDIPLAKRYIEKVDLKKRIIIVKNIKDLLAT